jgi:hypothetical protein
MLWAGGAFGRGAGGAVAKRLSGWNRGEQMGSKMGEKGWFSAKSPKLNCSHLFAFVRINSKIENT